MCGDVDGCNVLPKHCFFTYCIGFMLFQLNFLQLRAHPEYRHLKRNPSAYTVGKHSQVGMMSIVYSQPLLIIHECSRALFQFVCFNIIHMDNSQRFLISHLFHPQLREIISLSTFGWYSFFCFPLVGVKFVVITDPKQSQVDVFLQKVYELYSDYVLKNPFYAIDMPIKYVCV